MTAPKAHAVFPLLHRCMWCGGGPCEGGFCNEECKGKHSEWLEARAHDTER